MRQAIAKRPELASSEECAMVEFTDSASARTALQMILGDAKVFEEVDERGSLQLLELPQRI